MLKANKIMKNLSKFNKGILGTIISFVFVVGTIFIFLPTKFTFANVSAVLDENGVLTVSGKGRLSMIIVNGACSNDKNKIKKVNISKDILVIEALAFQDCHNLETVTFENNSQLEVYRLFFIL